MNYEDDVDGSQMSRDFSLCLHKPCFEFAIIRDFFVNPQYFNHPEIHGDQETTSNSIDSARRVLGHLRKQSIYPFSRMILGTKATLCPHHIKIRQ
jgi:hypothetical protein